VKIIRKCIVYPMACLLLKLSSQFNVTIATVGKSFSTMNFVKNQLRDHMRDEFFNDCRVIYMESDFFFFLKEWRVIYLIVVNMKNILQQIQNMKSHIEQLIL